MMDDRAGRRLHRMIEPALLAAGIVAVIVAAQLAQSVTAPPSAPARSPAASPSIGATDTGQRRMAPNFAAPAERTVVLAYRNADLCEPAEIRMDGTRYREALQHARHALDLARAAAFEGGEAWAQIYIGVFHAQLREHEQAMQSCLQPRAHADKVEQLPAQALIWDVVGNAHHGLGQHAEAITCHRRALRLNREMGDRFEEGNTLIHLGEALHSSGELDAARGAWEQAWVIFDDLHRAEAKSVQTRLQRLQFA